ncbi:Hypothetical protein NTJ_14419 [Nesidiocoris tenuis]|uniref:Uncharacterized protein n=1 Tax=Nesidiocoris tenuis TaxID=355587 RepID=A0ABN7BFI4_9HEMI|nr:Hypothetical protein NTJ_14419 [Nesidiocoris tenuis]
MENDVGRERFPFLHRKQKMIYTRYFRANPYLQPPAEPFRFSKTTTLQYPPSEPSYLLEYKLGIDFTIWAPAKWLAPSVRLGVLAADPNQGAPLLSRQPFRTK